VIHTVRIGELPVTRRWPAPQHEENDHEGSQFAPLAQEPAPRLPCCAQKRPRLRDQQDATPVQSPSGLRPQARFRKAALIGAAFSFAGALPAIRLTHLQAIPAETGPKTEPSGRTQAVSYEGNIQFCNTFNKDVHIL
jgi:hypothetical protein